MADLYLNQNVAAYHLDRQATREKNFNESNFGLGLERNDGNSLQMIGSYKNSMNKISYYALVGYTPLVVDSKYGSFKAGVIGGLVTGYDIPVVPALGALMSYQYKDIGVNLTVTPNATIKDTKAYGFLGLQMKYKIK